MKKPTIADVAEKAGVSKPTVSRYLKQENVKPEIAEKVKEAMSALGYVPKKAQDEQQEQLFVVEEIKEPAPEAVVVEPVEDHKIEVKKEPKKAVKKAVKKNETKEQPAEDKKAEPKKAAKPKLKKTPKPVKVKEKKGYRFAVLTKGFTSYRTRNMLEALQHVLLDYGCTFQVVATDGKEELEEAYLTSFIVQNVNAVFVEDCSSAEFITKQMRTTSIPVLFLKQDSSMHTALDEKKSANVLAKYLLDKRHLTIRYLGADDMITAKHLEGIREAYHALKQPVDIIPMTTDGSFENTFSKIKELFAEKIDLLILQSDEMAVPLSKYLKEYHIAVPQNVSMVSFGGCSIANVISPTLTTLSYRYEEYCEYIAQYAFALIEKKEVPVAKNFYYVEVRDSVR